MKCHLFEWYGPTNRIPFGKVCIFFLVECDQLLMDAEID